MTQSPHDHSSFSFQKLKDYDCLRDVLEAANYTDSGILNTLGVKDFSSIHGNDIPTLLRRTSQNTPLDTLIRLFLIEVPCDITAVRRAICPMELETWVEAGIVKIDHDAVIATLKLLPFQGLIVAFDLLQMLKTPLYEQYVMGIGSSTITLSNLTIKKHARLTLDLGTGCGIQALLAAKHSDHILAIDRNPRAVKLATFNARLNGISNIECLEGDFFEPVQGHTFDLVITNPPFVISPEKRYIYRDGGMQADQITQKIVRQVPQFLSEGGFSQILCNWVEKSDQDWRERLYDWCKGTGCDVWVMRSETRDAETYASTWIRHTERDEPEHFAKRFEKWMAYYEQHKIDSVGAGLITMRRSGGRSSHWFRADDAPEKMVGPCGEYIARGFELRDFLETMRDDSTLLNTRLFTSPDVRLERHYVVSDTRWIEKTTQLQLTRGLAYAGNIDPYMANMVMACDGTQQLSNLMSDMANSLGIERAQFQHTFCDVVRKLIERGFLLPANFIS